MNARPQFKHFPALDGLRGIAVVLVLIGHLELGSMQLGHGLQYCGPAGVEIFFLLSGFLITGLLLREKLETGDVNLVEFYKRRALRLAPAALGYLLFAYALYRAGIDTDSRWYSFAAALLYARNLAGRGDLTGHYWSLSAEEQFYTIWPLAMRRLGTRTMLWIALSAALTISLFRTLSILLWATPDYKTFYRPWYRCDAILIGCACALWYFGGLSTPAQRKKLCRFLSPLIVWPLLLLWITQRELIGNAAFLSGICLLSTAVVIPLFFEEAPNTATVFSHRWLRYLGKISYSLYLWQQPFLGSRVFHNAFDRLPVSLVATVVCALISHYLVERPFLRWKDRRKAVLAHAAYSTTAR